MGIIVPGLFVDPWFSALPWEEQKLWIGLIALEECGCIEADPEFLRSKIFPRGNWKTREKIKKTLWEFVSAGKVIPYEGGRFLYLANYLKYRGAGNHPKPRIPLPPWLRWVAYEGREDRGRLIFLEDNFPNSHSTYNHVERAVSRGNYQGYYQVNNPLNNGLITPLSAGYAHEDNPLTPSPEGALNLNSCSKKVRDELSKSTLSKVKERKDKVREGQNENLSLREKTKEDYPLSDNQSSDSQSLIDSQSLNDQSSLKENPSPQMWRHPPPKQDPVEAIPDPEERQRVKEALNEFLKTHCV